MNALQSKCFGTKARGRGPALQLACLVTLASVLSTTVLAEPAPVLATGAPETGMVAGNPAALPPESGAVAQSNGDVGSGIAAESEPGVESEAVSPSESQEVAPTRGTAILVGRTNRAVIYATRPAERIARSLVDGVEADRDAIARDLGRDYDGVTEIRIAHDAASFAELLPEGVSLPYWAQGVAFPSLNLVVMRAGNQSVLSTTRGTLRHELSHIAVGRLAGPGVPRWFLEGLATVHSGDAWSRQGPSLVRAALSDGLYSLDSLSRGFPSLGIEAELAYAQSADFVSFLIERGGEERLGQLLRLLVEGSEFDDAIVETFGVRLRALENEWRRDIARWELVARFFTSPDVWWGGVTIMAVFAWVSLRRRKKERLEEMAQEELEEEQILADERWLDSMRVRAERVAASRADFADDVEILERIDRMERGEGNPDDFEFFDIEPELPTKKPTLH